MSDDLADVARQVEAELARRSFAEFVRLGAWDVIEPTRALLPSVALDGICSALEAAAAGRIKRLAIACPPGVSKSLLGAVAWPAWLLLRTDGRARIMAGSYSWAFAERDARRCRDLIASPWYQGLVRGAWQVRGDADQRADYWTTAGGRRLIVSVGGKALGERCTVQVIDDALSGADVHSTAAKREAARWISEVLPSRLESPDDNPRVLIGQRLAVDDPIAAAVERGFTLLSLPAVLAEGEAPCELRDDAGELVWRDPRAPGEPLFALHTPAALAQLRLELGSTAYSAQYLQAPADDTNARLRRSWWRFHRAPHVPATAPRPAGCDTEHAAIETPSEFDAQVIACDLTFGAERGDHAVAVCWASKGGARFLLDMWRARGAGLEASVAAIAGMVKRYPRAAVVIEKAANGAAVIETLRKQIPHVLPVKPIGSKEARIAAMAPAVEAGACHLPLGAAWLADVVEECAGNSKWDDIPDACAYGLHRLAMATRGTRMSAPPVVLTRLPGRPFDD